MTKEEHEHYIELLVLQSIGRVNRSTYENWDDERIIKEYERGLEVDEVMDRDD